MVRDWRWISASCLAILALSAPVSAAPAPEPVSSNQSAEELLGESSAHDVICARYPARAWLRRKIVCEADLAKYGLRMEGGWEHADPAKPVAILIHGFNSTPEQNAAMMVHIREAGFPCGAFSYPNDQSLLASAQLLSSDLRRFGQKYPGRRVVLVCHSMGGLVARACVEDSLYDPGNVERLILIAPPTHGTLLAHFAVGTDLWEHWLSRKEGGPWQRVRDSIVDGLGEAADDLCPESPFLHDLNCRPLNSHVKYSIFLGTGAALSDGQVEWIRKSVCEKLEKVPGACGGAERLDAILADIDELVEGKGDGVVAVKRGRLDGVADTLVIPFGHLAVTGEPCNEPVRDAQSAVLERIR
jgi:pimeloyl-ACP methyl ester carboxylesterase